MRRFSNISESAEKRGFTLIEVIIAVGILAGSALAIIAFLGATGQATSEVLDRTVAARIADNVRAELDATDIATLLSATSNPNVPVELYATKDGERVRLEGSSADAPEASTPPGIANRNRYFKIEVRQMEKNSLEPSGPISDSTMLALSVQVIWPHHLPQGPAGTPPESDPYTDVSSDSPHQQSRYIFNTVILRKQ